MSLSETHSVNTAAASLEALVRLQREIEARHPEPACDVLLLTEAQFDAMKRHFPAFQDTPAPAPFSMVGLPYVIAHSRDEYELFKARLIREGRRVGILTPEQETA